ncbi:MAG: hypothetical protein MJA82_01650 [Clostridia bacterium]|nr:hypothetical protein [Clostridia bacterium]
MSTFMRTEFQTAKITLTQKTHEFIFDGNIMDSEVFIKGFNLQYPGKDHHVKEAEIEVVQSITDGNRISVSITGLLKDGSGNFQDNNRSFVTVVVVALIEILEH